MKISPAHASRILAAAFLSAMITGCGTNAPPPAIQPVSFDPSRTAEWFAGDITADLADEYQAAYEEGRELRAAEDHGAAARQYQALAAQGVVEAAYELGKAYRYGWGVQQDPATAAQWLIAAVSTPNARRAHASYHLGELLLDGEGIAQDVSLARRLFHQALEGGYKRAGLPLARIYSGNLGVAAQPDYARQLAEEAAASGDVESHLWLMRAYQPSGSLGDNPARVQELANAIVPKLMADAENSADTRAMRDLAAINFEGLGRAPDSKEGIGWLVRAATAGEPGHMVSYGRDILQGSDGLSVDPAQGLTLLQMASEVYGQHEALTRIAEAYRDGSGVARNERQAAVWFERAIAAGHTKAYLEYGRMLARDVGDDANMTKAVELLRQAGESGEERAWADLGRLHLDDAFRGADPAQGVAYLRRAHDAGIGSVTDELGIALLAGRAGPPNPQEAESLLIQAAEAGSIPAAEALGRAYLKGDVLPPQPTKAEHWLARAVAAGSGDAKMLLARGLLSGQIPGNPALGREVIESAAINGDTEAMMDLARALRDGRMVSRDPDAARIWFARAEAAGDPGAREALAALNFETATDGRLDVVQLTAAADAGHAGAMSILGQAYLKGDSVERDPATGVRWLGRAIQAGNMDAAANLGTALLHGSDGVPRDGNQGRALLERAAAADITDAKRDLGIAMIRGEGIPANPERGMGLLREAADTGDVHAMELLGSVYLHGADGVRPRPEEGITWLSRAADRGDLSAMTQVGKAHLDGTMKSPDPNRGLTLLARAAEGGDPTAMTHLGELYSTGSQTIPKDPQRARRYLQLASDGGHAGAMAALGRAYVNGDFGPDLINEGARLLFMSARAGHASARYALAEAFLKSQGLEGANSDYAESWLQTVVAGDTEVAVQTLTEMLRESQVRLSEGEQAWRPSTSER